MYYSAGTYEAFAHPEKPQGVDNKSAYIIGTGLAGLTAAFYLVRDGQMKGERVHLLEKLDLVLTLGDLGLTEENIPWMTENCQKVSAGNLVNTTVPIDAETIAEIYRRAM